MRLLHTVSLLVATLVGCGGEIDDGWSSEGDWARGERALNRVIRLDSEQAMQIAPTPAQLQRLEPLSAPDPGDASTTLHPDHYTLSDDKYCGHTGCPADETAPCEPHSAGVAKPMCACRVRGYLFICH